MKVALGKISSIQMGYSFRFGLEYMNRGEIAVIQMKNLAEDQVDCVNLLRIEMTQLDLLDNDLLETKKMLFKLRRGIDDRIEPILLENNSIDGSGFIKYVLKHGQVIYSRQ